MSDNTKLIKWLFKQRDMYDEIIDLLCHQPTKSKGHWILSEFHKTCSICRGTTLLSKGINKAELRVSYCQYCGADMRELPDEDTTTTKNNMGMGSFTHESPQYFRTLTGNDSK